MAVDLEGMDLSWNNSRWISLHGDVSPAHSDDCSAHIDDGSAHSGDGSTHIDDGSTHSGDGSTHIDDGSTHIDDGSTHSDDDEPLPQLDGLTDNKSIKFCLVLRCIENSKENWKII